MDSPKIIFQDENILVIDKPAGWIVNESTNTSTNPVLQDWLSQNFDYQIAKEKEVRSGIVHRLDKETSGVLLVAKNIQTFEKLQFEFAQRKVQKTYTALAHGKVEPKTGTINEKIGRLPWKRTKFGVWEGGREAQTDYKVLDYYSKEGKDYTLLELYPKTGRTHQIRVHLKHIGHPIVSDPLYSGRKTNRQDRKWCPRLFLHASNLSILNLNFKSDLPSDLKSALNSFHD
ncbi:MAG TPA: RluA family pseudouridine synthase [Patescibacteria group bacterium]